MNTEQTSKNIFTRINTVSEELNEYGKIDEKFLKSIKSVGRQLPRLQGLAKVHKENIPVRLVFSVPRSPYYKLAEKINGNKLTEEALFTWAFRR